MKRIGELSLGIVTGVGGYLDISSLVTSAQAGAVFAHQLMWAVLLGGLCAAFLCEQGGRLAAVSGRTVSDAIRERFGFPYHLLLYAVLVIVTLLILAIEIGGVSVAIEFATGIPFAWWAVPVTLLCWLLLWKGSYAFVQYGVSGASLITVCFVVGAVVVHPHWVDVAWGLLPTLPRHDGARYWLLAATIVSASITPYMLVFYASGAVEDRWTVEHLGINRIAAFLGMGFGSVIAGAVVVLAATSLLPLGIDPDHYAQLALLMIDALGWWGFVLLVASLGIACLGTALEVALALAYLTAQGFGWEGSQDAAPRDHPRFCATYTIALVLGAVPVVLGIEPVRMTTISMAATALTLPIAVVPFLFVMNDPAYLERHVNGWLSNAVVIGIIGMTFVVAVASVPLVIFGELTMKLVHEVLDAQLLDRGDRKIGRIDTIVLALADDGPPRVVAVECGPVALAGRVHPRLAERLARWLRRRGSVLATPVRLDWATLRRVRNDFVAETVDAATTPIVAGERWTRDRVIGRIPGA